MINLFTYSARVTTPLQLESCYTVVGGGTVVVGELLTGGPPGGATVVGVTVVLVAPHPEQLVESPGQVVVVVPWDGGTVVGGVGH